MTEALGGIRSVLKLPAVFRLFNCLLGGPRTRAEFVRQYVRPRPGDRVMDIGCGTGELVEFLPGTDYVGFDVNAEYIQAARSRHDGRGKFIHGAVGTSLLASEAPFDLAIASAVLHHLDDAKADRLFAEARDLLKPGGRLVTCDPCWVEGQSPIARWLISMDRGRAVRAPKDLEKLAARHFSEIRSDIRHDLLRIPFTHVVLECSNTPIGRAAALPTT